MKMYVVQLIGRSLSHIRTTACRRSQAVCSTTRQCNATSYINRSCLHVWPSMKFWPKIDVAASENVMKYIDGAQNRNEILDVLPVKEVKEEMVKNCKVMTYILRRVTFTQYLQCEESYPYKAWLKNDIHLAFKQLQPTSHLKTVMAPVLQNVQFKELMLAVDNLGESLTTEHVSEVLLLLLYLGVDKHDLLLRKLYLKAKRELHESNWNSIDNVLRSASTMAAADFRLFAVVLNIMRKRLESNDNIGSNHEETVCFLQAIESCKTLFSRRLCELLSTELNKILSDKEFMKNTHNATKWVSALGKIYGVASVNVQVSLEKDILRFQQMLERSQERFSVLQIGQMMRYMDKIYPPSAPRLLPMSEYVNQETVKSLELKGLLIAAAYCEKKEVNNPNLQKNIRLHLHDKLSEHFSNDLESLVDFELVFKILSQGGLEGRLRELLLSLIRTNMYFVLAMEPNGVVVTKEFFEDNYSTMLRNIRSLSNGMAAVRNQEMCILSAFAIANSKRTASCFEIEKLKRILYNCDMQHVALLIKGLRQLGKKEQSNDTTELYRIVLEHVRGVVKDLGFVDLDCIYHLTMAAGAPERDILTGKIIMSEIEKHLSGHVTFLMKEKAIMKILLTFYYSPVIMEYLAQSVLTHISETEQHQEKLVLSTLAVLATFGYKPKCMTEFQWVALNVFRKAKSEQRWNICVEVLSSLCSLEIYPEEELKSCFTDSAKEDLINFVAKNKDIDFIRRISTLSRTVFLNRPDLDIPYFGKGGLTRRYSKSDHSVDSRRAEEKMYTAIAKMLHGNVFVNRNVLIYDIGIDFEIALDRNGKVLPVAQEGFQFTGEDQRIAIIPVSRGQMACNNRDVLLSNNAGRKASLEALGYDVIHVLSNSWEHEEEFIMRQLYDAIFRCQDRRNLLVITGYSFKRRSSSTRRGHTEF